MWFFSKRARKNMDESSGELYRVKYSSMLTAQGDQAEVDLASFLAAAIKNNPEHHITGMLYYDRQTKRLVQVLEGPMCNVNVLMERILQDNRHTDCEVRERRLVASRVYSEFGMALARTSDPAGDEQQHAQRGLDAMEHLVRLQYTSRLDAAGADEGRRLVQSIVEASVRNNSQRKIGGLLCFNPSTLMISQLLEGPADAVRDLFLTILADTRHVDCRLTSEELLFSPAERLFANSWGMLQSETEDSQHLDLSSRLWRAGMQHATAARKELLAEEAFRGGPDWQETPSSDAVMCE